MNKTELATAIKDSKIVKTTQVVAISGIFLGGLAIASVPLAVKNVAQKLNDQIANRIDG